MKVSIFCFCLILKFREENEKCPIYLKMNKTLKKHKCYLELQWLRLPKQMTIITYAQVIRPKQKGLHLADDIFKMIFLNEYVQISIKISLKFVPRCPINNIPVLFG